MRAAVITDKEDRRIAAEAEEVDDFAARWERVSAQLENRAPRKHLGHAPSQERRHVAAAEILAAGRGAVI